jgi:hypothetical protein
MALAPGVANGAAISDDRLEETVAFLPSKLGTAR